QLLFLSDHCIGIYLLPPPIRHSIIFCSSPARPSSSLQSWFLELAVLCATLNLIKESCQSNNQRQRDFRLAMYVLQTFTGNPTNPPPGGVSTNKRQTHPGYSPTRSCTAASVPFLCPNLPLAWSSGTTVHHHRAVYTFLATLRLILLLDVSAAIAVRPRPLCRRRIIAEAIANGTGAEIISLVPGSTLKSSIQASSVKK
ncbi:hypothetical protein B0H13DRAFT_2568435, partial [Mycena leptocephala]